MLHPLELKLGVQSCSILALRMLYSSTPGREPYSTFLHNMDPRLHCIEPIDVLHFWKEVGQIPDGIPWMAVFAVDEV